MKNIYTTCSKTIAAHIESGQLEQLNLRIKRDPLRFQLVVYPGYKVRHFGVDPWGLTAAADAPRCNSCLHVHARVLLARARQWSASITLYIQKERLSVVQRTSSHSRNVVQAILKPERTRQGCQATKSEPPSPWPYLKNDRNILLFK